MKHLALVIGMLGLLIVLTIISVAILTFMLETPNWIGKAFLFGLDLIILAGMAAVATVLVQTLKGEWDD